MPKAITALLFCLWMAVAWRLFQRGETMLAGVCLVVGVLLSVYRWKLWQSRHNAAPNDQPPPS